MTDAKSERRPRRDPNGRLATFGDLVGTCLAGLVTGVVLVLVLEAILSVTRISHFGDTSGWLAAILPVWLFVEEFRAEKFGANRVVVAVLAAGFGVAAGLSFAGLAAIDFPRLVSGFVGAAVLAVVYSLIWFYGLRWLSHRAG
ncbi:hypothetical protein ACIA5C_39450 [Actinoplanes sp. NPDC051343]|jgi:uncharacterized PurR-regulated membrane protein YhhQ (DUF165 family)|uniref:hypothetical protein n=1 Tax=Actinoplanes sp. NPDC051343 TaxID=3363906 RepID=UPI0037A3061B